MKQIIDWYHNDEKTPIPIPSLDVRPRPRYFIYSKNIIHPEYNGTIHIVSFIYTYENMGFWSTGHAGGGLVFENEDIQLWAEIPIQLELF